MDEISGLTPTGRRLRGPASDLVELNGENGLRHTAIVFHDEYLEHRALNQSFELVRGFLESPWVTGLMELSDRQGGAFVYPCGECWSVAEVNRILADLGQVGGVRAGLELMYCAGRILIEAAEAGESEGVYSHGGLTPWRVMIRRDGQVLVLGHALPQVEILMFHEDGQRIPREDSFRYCPPERIEQGAEDVSSDLFGLALIGFELMTGRPVYDGLVNDIRQQAARGEGSRRLFRFRDKLPDVVRECLTVALRRDVADRYASGPDFLAAVQEALAAPEVTGSSLMDVMAHVTRQDRRSGNRPDSASTMMASVAEVRSMAGVSADSSKDELARFSSPRAGEKPRARSPIVKSDEEIPSGNRERVEMPKPDVVDMQKNSAPESSTVSVPDAPVIPQKIKGKTRPSRRSPRRPRNPVDSVNEISSKEQKNQGLVQSILGESSKSKGGTPRFEKGRASRGKTPSDQASAASSREKISSGEATSPKTGSKTSSSPTKASSSLSSAPTPGVETGSEMGPESKPMTGAVQKSGLKSDSGRRPHSGQASRSSGLVERVRSQSRSTPAAPSVPKSTPKSAPPRVKPLPKRVQPAESVEPVSSVSISREVSPKAKQSLSSVSAAEKKSKLTQVVPPSPAKPAAKETPKGLPRTQLNTVGKAKAKEPPRPKSKPAVKAKRVDVDAESMRTAIFSQAELRARLLADESSDSPKKDGQSPRTKFLKVQFPDSAKLEKIPVSPEWTVGQLVQSWMGERFRIRTDLTGRLQGWPRLYLGEQRLSGSTLLSEVDDGQQLQLAWVQNEEVMVDLLVKQPNGDQRVLTPMASAIPMGILLDYLRDWLNLDDGPLKVTTAGRSLGLSEILADLNSEKGRIVLTVERVEPQ